jgi:WD40 repeat protein
MKQDEYPIGLKLIASLEGHQKVITRLAWSPDGTQLLSGAQDGFIINWDYLTSKIIKYYHPDGEKLETFKLGYTRRNIAWSPIWSNDGTKIACGYQDTSIRIWDVKSGKILKTLKKHNRKVNNVSWSKDNSVLASCADDAKIYLWDWENAKIIDTYIGHIDGINNVIWSPDGALLASCSLDAEIIVWDIKTNKILHRLKGHTSLITTVIWSKNGKSLYSSSYDGTIRVWDLTTGKQTNILEGHSSSVSCISLSNDGLLLSSKGNIPDSKVKLWRTDTFKEIASLNEPSDEMWFAGIAFHNHEPILATLDKNDTNIRIWKLNYEQLLSDENEKQGNNYTNAKVVLLGDSSTGKSCLARALLGKPFVPQESTHGMKVWNFHSENIISSDGTNLHREIILWDLAGQTDYQIVHQLFLDRTNLFIILFDASNPEMPFKGVLFWIKVIRKIIGINYRYILVSGRSDRGYPVISTSEINDFVKNNNIIEYYNTSAKTNLGIPELKNQILNSIPWNDVTVTSSPIIWHSIREYIETKRNGNEVLTNINDLYEAFKYKYSNIATDINQFKIVIEHAQTQGLLWRMSFGNYVLLKSELLNDYASAIIRVARKHPAGLGSVNEDNIRNARLDFEDLQRIKNKENEKLLLLSVVELFINREIAFLEDGQLIFPSKFSRKQPKDNLNYRTEFVYDFIGSSEEIFATLIVRLYNSEIFELIDIWNNTANFQDILGNLCGVRFDNETNNFSTVNVYFSDNTTIESKVVFLKFIYNHLEKKSIQNSLTQKRIYWCKNCNERFTDTNAIEIRIKRGKQDIICQYCDSKTELIDLLEEKFNSNELITQVRSIEKDVNSKRKKTIGENTVKAKMEIGEFDVFLAHNSADKKEVIELSNILKSKGINTWLDTEQIPPGKQFQDIIQQVIPKVKSVAIIVGNKGIGKWQKLEINSFINQCVERDLPIIPILMPKVNKIPNTFSFLSEFNWVSFFESIDEEETISKLIWGITGERPKNY